jgi:hypothetical protein
MKQAEPRSSLQPSLGITGLEDGELMVPLGYLRAMYPNWSREGASINLVLHRAIAQAASCRQLNMETRVVHVVFVVDKMALGLILLQVF